nr:phospholipase-like protein [Tanacetum cinerariifolium]
EELRLELEEEEMCHLEEYKMMEVLFLSSLKEDVRKREKKDAKITNGKRSQRPGAFSSYYWGDTFVKAENDRPFNGLNDQDMTQFLKDVMLWVEDLSRYNKATDIVHLIDAFDIFLGRPGPLCCKFPWCKDVSVDERFWESLVCLDPRKKCWIMDEDVELWVNYMWHVRPHDANWTMVRSYVVQLLLQYTIPFWYADGTSYKVAWSDVDKVFMPINETDQHWCLAQLHIRTRVVTFYESGITYDPKWREWMIISVSIPYYSKLHGFNNDEQPIIEVDDIGYQMDTTLKV